MLFAVNRHTGAGYLILLGIQALWQRAPGEDTRSRPPMASVVGMGFWRKLREAGR
ncbi:hypothetical protein [Actinoplanes sp. NPDC026623]|uniref:hypothetical protein n=1 Tax=Actinoplanes sp. NPDC026623 TaxID=3155610 RepID=UPI0033CE8C49